MTGWEVWKYFNNIPCNDDNKPVIIYDGYKEYTNFDICVTDKAIWIEVHEEDENG